MNCVRENNRNKGNIQKERERETEDDDDTRETREERREEGKQRRDTELLWPLAASRYGSRFLYFLFSSFSQSTALFHLNCIPIALPDNHMSSERPQRDSPLSDLLKARVLLFGIANTHDASWVHEEHKVIG